MKDFPKNYDECCNVFNTTPEDVKDNIKLQYGTEALKIFSKVIVCRNAYLMLFEMYGDKTELATDRYVIKAVDGAITKAVVQHSWEILSFPTAKMRDAFYDNFEEDLHKIVKML